MRSRPTILILICLLCLAGAWLFWPHTARRVAESNSPPQKSSSATPTAIATTAAPKTSPLFSPLLARTNEFAYRLSNTAKSIGELKDDRRAILLENALIDTRLPLNFSIPKNLQPAGDPGAYIVQANGLNNAAFRALLTAAGAQIISYIPNNAYLVRVPADGAASLARNAATASVIPYEPYYKILNSSLLGAAVRQNDLPDGTPLTLGLFADNAEQTIAQIEKMGGKILATDRSPFGPMVRVAPPQNWTALADLPGVQIMEPYHARIHANDLSRATTGVAVNSTAPTNYLNLSGSNVLVAMADTGIDATHPDFKTGTGSPIRVFGSPEVLVDTNSHGTFIAGEIAGNGFESTTVTNAEGSINPGTNFQYRGKAPLAKLFIMSYQTNSDQALQQGAAISNALIANESWNLDGDTLYDLEAASYDAATRDSLAGTTGSQSVLYVFSAGNDGGGGNNGIDGTQGSVLSPATAKDVIAVGATEEQRNITNYVTAANGTSNQVWLPETDTSFEVASFSARGNVGVGTEGTKGRYKPDVVAPGTFTISTRSQQWDQKVYYFQSSTNFQDFTYQNQTVGTNSDFNLYSISVPANAIGVVVIIEQNSNSFLPSNMPIYVQQSDYPDPVNDPSDIDFTTHNDMVSIPPDSGGNITGLQSILGDGFFFAIGNSTNVPITYNVLTEIITTNSLGNGQIVLSNLNNSIGPWYRYESGTSMAAGDVSGTLALIQDYFTNTLHTLPSPALLKALLVNGARAVGNYNFNQSDSKNYQGWGLINLPNSVPAGSTNPVAGSNSVFYLDQSPTNALATGDSHTFIVNISSNSTALPFRVTAAWTDPPGNPAAAIKLVNNLDLIVSNMATNIVYYGNDIPVSSIYNEVGSTNAPNLDIINNIENVFLPPLFAGTYSVTVVGRGVNVNAVTAQSNNIVQDYALVISSGGGLTPGSISVTDLGNVSRPTSDQLITGVTATNAPMFNQYVGANAPTLGTNTVAGGGAGTAFATNSLVTVGMTNQWHFYIVTNTGANSNFTNSAFVTFLPPTLSIPREGVFAGSDANSTTPEADIDLYVASLQSDSNAASLTNLNPTVISNCVHGLSGDNASLSRGGTEFVVYTNSAPGQIYYVGVKSETQMASEYAFLPVFTQTPFSQLNPDGSETVNGIPLPTAIPDGSPAHPGAGYVFGLALQPMQIQNVTVSNQITHQNIGDLIGVLAHDSQTDVLNNHYSTNSPPAPGPYNFLYDDSQNPIAGSQPSAGKGLGKFVGQQAVGAWQLTEVDDSQGQTGSVTGFSLNITPHIDPTKQPVTVTLAPGQFYTTYVDVPVGATNLTIFATNTTGTAVPPVELFVRYGTPPTTNSYDATTPLNTPSPLGKAGFISISATNQPPIRSGRYFFSLFNASSSAQSVTYFATIGIPLTGATPLDFNSSGPTPLPDDAVTTSTISVPNSDPISAINVGIRVDHPRISDLAFHLISPDGSRYSLMENRGATTTNGAGASYFTTNTTSVPHNGNADAYTNVINTGTTNGTITINYDFFSIPDTMEIFDGANLLTNTGLINGSATFSINYSGSPIVTIIMNPGGNTNNPTTAWTYSVTSTTAKYTYLTFVEDTNLTTTPIKFAPTPFTPKPFIPTNLFLDGFETNTPRVYTIGQKVGDFNEFTVTSNSVTVVNDPTNAASGSNYLSLGTGGISAILPTVVGQPYIFQYSYRGADLSIVGGVQEISVAASTNWQTHYVRFTAAQTGTPVTIQGTGPGALLDNVTFTELPPTLYFQPEQSLDPLVGTVPSGIWTMEVQDDRVGAYDSNSPPMLQDWQLEFVFASTNALKPPIFTNTPANIVMDEQTTNHVTNSAMPGVTNLTLTYSLLNPPADGWVQIDPNTGIITLTPQEIDGPTNWTVITMVTDNGSPSLSSVNSFNVTVNEVNVAPVLPTNQPPQTVDEQTLLTVTNGATDSDIPTNALSYAVSISVNTGAMITNGWPTNFATTYPLPQIDTNGIITWLPNETNGPGVYTITTIVTDTNPPAVNAKSLSDTNHFDVTVNEVNIAPTLPTNLPNVTIDEGTLLVVTNTAADVDIPANNLFYNISPPIPGVIINPNGIITWTPSEAQGPGVYTITTIVTDFSPFALINQNLSATNSFTVTVNEVNSAPILILPADTNIVETVLFTNSATVTNQDIPPDTFTFTLVSGPTGLSIDPTNGLISWTPTEAQGPSTNLVTISASDLNTNALTNQVLSVTNSFTIIVLESNLAPVFTNSLAGTNFFVNELTPFIVTNTASDPDIPTNILTYGLTTSVTGTNQPAINSTNGIITWLPNEAQGPGIYTFTNTVTDNGVPPLSDTNIFTVTVNEVNVAPALPPDRNLTNLELVPITITNTATDSDIPTNALTYVLNVSLNTNAMNAMVPPWPLTLIGANPPVISTNGIITWMPSEAQGPGVYIIMTIVTDTNPPAVNAKSLSTTNIINLVVNETNLAPVFNPLPTNTFTVTIPNTLTITNTAFDSDIPTNALTYTLFNPPTGMTNNPTNGIITWTPTGIYAGTTNSITNIVTDFNPYAVNSTNLSTTNFFTVIVLGLPPYSATLAATAVTGTNAQMNGMATPNGSPAFAWFEYGFSTSYGNQTTNVPVGSGTNVVYVTNLLGGLSLPQEYHYRLDTSNSVAVTYGFDQIFDVGGVTAWGDSSSGLINVPAILTNTAVAISGGFNHNIALRNNGRPVAWGDNSFGQTNVPASVTNAVAVSAGGNFNLALRNTGRVVAWGYNVDGETNVPGNLSNVVAIAAGGYHSLALRTNGTIIAWGYNVAGETNVPANLSNVVAVAAGLFHSVALKNDGTLAAWGYNADGETTIPAGLKNVAAIAAGEYFNLALKTNGTVVAWGLNTSGQTNVPPGLSNVVAIAAGGFHSLALKSDGTVVAWGDDTKSQTNVPAGLGIAAAVAAGGYHSLALVAAPSLNHAPSFVIPNQTNHFINVGAVLSVTNTATDPDVPAQTLTYALLNPPANAAINSGNGIITFTPVAAQAGTTNAIVTTVTDNGAPPLSATNSFFVFVNPYPAIGGVTFTTNALTLTWTAWTNEQFQVQWKTNLASVIPWNTFPPIITSATGTFSFTDTNAPFLTKFYRLILLP